MSETSSATPERRRSGYRTLLGYRTRAWSENYGEVEVTLGPQHMNSIGIVHGGVYASLLDAAFGHAVSYCTVPGNARYSTTVSLTTTFLKGAKDGVLVASAKVDGIDGRLATCSGEVRDEAGNLLAVAQGSFLYFPGSEHPQGQPKRERST
jgi:uncharacterized protein (TIGR00369 family)